MNSSSTEEGKEERLPPSTTASTKRRRTGEADDGRGGGGGGGVGVVVGMTATRTPTATGHGKAAATTRDAGSLDGNFFRCDGDCHDDGGSGSGSVQQEPSMESILGVPLEILFRQVGDTSMSTGAAVAVAGGGSTMELDDEDGNASGTGRPGDAGGSDCGGSGAPIMNRVEADQFLNVLLLAQELDVLTSLAEQVLGQQNQARRFRTVITERYSHNPWVTPLLPVLAGMGRSCRSKGDTAAPHPSPHHPSPLHDVHASLVRLTWDLQRCAFQLQQSAEQNWALVDSLLDVLQPSDVAAFRLTSEKRALAELQGEVARRIHAVLELQNETTVTTTAEAAAEAAAAATPQREGREEGWRHGQQRRPDDGPQKSQTTQAVEQHPQQKQQEQDSRDSSRRKLFPFQDQDQQQPQRHHDEHQQSSRSNQPAADAHGSQESCSSRGSRTGPSNNVDPILSADVYTPLADFCARVFSYGKRPPTSMVDYVEEGGGEEELELEQAKKRQQPKRNGTMDPPQEKIPCGPDAVAINLAAPAAPATAGACGPKTFVDHDATLHPNDVSLSQASVAGTMMMMMLHTQASAKKKAHTPQSTQRHQGGLATTISKSCQHKLGSDSFTGNGGGKGNKESKLSDQSVYQEFTAGSQSPSKGFVYPDAATLEAEGHLEDSQMSIHNKTRAAEALAGMVDGSS